MFKATVYNKEDVILLEVESENRGRMRSLSLLCEENKLSCEVTEEVKPRTVKFKGID